MAEQTYARGVVDVERSAPTSATRGDDMATVWRLMLAECFGGRVELLSRESS